jgi:hypothetical protein
MAQTELIQESTPRMLILLNIAHLLKAAICAYPHYQVVAESHIRCPIIEDIQQEP